MHAFEPVPELYQRVRQRIRSAKNANAYELALSDEVGTAVLHVSEYEGSPDVPSASSSLFEPKDHLEAFPAIKFEKTITVETTTIDAWAEKRGIPRVDLLYLDIQGAELAAMKGAPRMMETVQVVLTELEFVELYADQPRYGEVKSWLEGQGFQMIAGNFHPLRPRQALFRAGDQQQKFGDAIFVRRTALEAPRGSAPDKQGG